MGDTTEISWCDATHNEWEGCQKIGPGCDHCYAETRNARFNGGQAIHWGPGAPRRRTSAANRAKPLRWDRLAAAEGRRWRVFCSSLSDVFDNAVDPSWRRELFATMRATPNLDWLVLTKRVGNVLAMAEEAGGWPANAWLGVTIVNQAEAERDIPRAMRAKAALAAPVLFLSCEPLLGPLDLARVTNETGAGALEVGAAGRVDWVIAGGESGAGARPMHPDWARRLRDQCAAAGVAFHFKQWGQWRPINQGDEAWSNALYVSKRAARAGESQEAIDESYGKRCTVATRVVHADGSAHELLADRAFAAGTGAMQTFAVGKEAAGRDLDGRIHAEFPAQAAPTAKAA